MTLLKPWPIQPAGGDADTKYSGDTLRDAFAGLYVAETVLGDATSLKVTQRGAGADMSVDVAAGWCAVQGDDGPGQGMYLCRSTAAVNVAVPAAPGSGSRTHRIVARVKDKSASGSWSTYEWTPDIIADTSGSLPALDPTCLELARVSVAAAQASVVNGNITDLRRWRGLAGGIMGIADASGRPSDPYQGMHVYRMDLDVVEQYTGSAWRTPAGGSWTAFPYAAGLETFGSPHATSGYRKIPLGPWVELRGSIKKSSAANFTGITTLGTLPSGYRPAAEVNQPVAVQFTSSMSATGRVRIQTDGTVEYYSDVTVAWVGLDGVRFEVP